MGVCLCNSACGWGCLWRVPSSISRLPFSDGHWSSISTHSPDWCCTTPCWKAGDCYSEAATCLLQHLFTAEEGGKKILFWRGEAQMCIDGELSKCLKLFAFQEFVCKWTVSLGKNNVLEKQRRSDNRAFLEWILKSKLPHVEQLWTLTDRLYKLPW